MKHIKDILIGMFFGLIVGLVIIFIMDTLTSITIFEDGSFTGCLPFALCYFG
jgi:hypothetical protein